MQEAFVLSTFQQDLEDSFYVFEPDFDKVEKELLDEEKTLAEKLQEFGISWNFSDSYSEEEKEEFKEKLRIYVLDPIIYENTLRRVVVKEESVLIQFSFPGSGKKYWAEFLTSEVEDLPLELQRRMLNTNLYLFPYVDTYLVNIKIKEIKFFRGKEKDFVKFILSSGQEVVYCLEENKQILSYIKEKFDIAEKLEESWREFKNSLSRVSESRKAITRAEKIYKKESGLSDWLQYTVLYSDSVLYIFKPRRGKNGEVFYSIFKVLKGDPQMGIPDKVEGLFALSTDKFLKEWEPLLERR